MWEMGGGLYRVGRRQHTAAKRCTQCAPYKRPAAHPQHALAPKLSQHVACRSVEACAARGWARASRHSWARETSQPPGPLTTLIPSPHLRALLLLRQTLLHSAAPAPCAPPSCWLHPGSRLTRAAAHTAGWCPKTSTNQTPYRVWGRGIWERGGRGAGQRNPNLWQ